MNAQDRKTVVQNSIHQLRLGTGRDTVQVAAILEGMLYVGESIEALRDDLYRAREAEEVRHRELVEMITGAVAPPISDRPLIWTNQLKYLSGRRDEAGNALFEQERSSDGKLVTITDALGGHEATIAIEEWEAMKPIEQKNG